jgi:hypothetical protein
MFYLPSAFCNELPSFFFSLHLEKVDKCSNKLKQHHRRLTQGCHSGRAGRPCCKASKHASDKTALVGRSASLGCGLCSYCMLDSEEKGHHNAPNQLIQIDHDSAGSLYLHHKSTSVSACPRCRVWSLLLDVRLQCTGFVQGQGNARQDTLSCV